MTDKYIVIKVRDGDSGYIEGGYMTKVGVIRRALHELCKEADISIADTVTHSIAMTNDESEQIATAFESALTRAKLYSKRYPNKKRKRPND